MALKKIPVQIEVDKLCDSFVKDFCSQSKRLTLAEAHKITKLVRQLSATYTEDTMSTAIERFEARMDAIEKSQSQTKWLLGLLVALIIALFGVILSNRQPTQNQPPVQQQQVQPQVQVQPVQPQQTVEPAEHSGQTVTP